MPCSLEAELHAAHNMHKHSDKASIQLHTNTNSETVDVLSRARLQGHVHLSLLDAAQEWWQVI